MVEMMNYDYDTSDVVGGFRKDFVNVVNVSGRASDNNITMPRFALANLRVVIMGEAEVNENNFAMLSTSDKELFIASDTHDDESFKKETGWVLKNRDREWTIAIKIKCNLPFWKMKSHSRLPSREQHVVIPESYERCSPRNAPIICPTPPSDQFFSQRNY